MKLIIDAQLPFGLKQLLVDLGHDVIHTDDLDNKERTTDSEIRQLSIVQNRVVISKDFDFVDSFYVTGIPKKLLVISTGNIKNRELYNLFSKNISKIVSLFETSNLIEMDNDDIITHE